MRSQLKAGVAAIAVLGASIAPAAAVDITFYDTMSGANFVQWWQTTALPMCKDAFDGEVRYTSAGSAEVLQRLKAAGEGNGDIDILFLAPDKIAAFKKEGVLADLTALDIANLANTEEPDSKFAAGTELEGTGAPFFRYSYTLIYNSDFVENPPKTFQELYERRDEWKGRISYVDPRSTVSGAGRFFVAMFLQSFGSDLGFTADGEENETWAPAWEKLAEFEQANAPKHAESGGSHMAQFASGEIVIGFHALDFAIFSRKQGTIPPSMQTQLPGDGTPGGAGYLAIPANVSDEQKAAAASFIDCALSSEVQAQMTNDMYQFPGTNSWDALSDEAKAVMPSKDEYTASRSPDPSAEALSHIAEVWSEKSGY